MIKYWMLVVCFYWCQALACAQTLPFTIVLGNDCHLGLMDEHGKELLPKTYATIDVESVGNAYLISTRVKQTAAFFLYQGEKMIELPYPVVERFNDRLLKVGNGDQYGLINTDGKGIAVINYQSIASAGVEAAITQLQNRYGVLNVDGKVLLANKYEAVQYWEGTGFWMQKEGVYTLHDEGGLLKQTTAYTAVQVPKGSWSLCAVAQKGKWGLVNKTATIVVPLKYQQIRFFEAGIIATQHIDGQWELWTADGKRLSEERFETVQTCGQVGCMVKKGKKHGVIASTGKFKLPLQENLLVYINKHCLLEQQGTAWKVIDLNTQKQLDIAFDAYQYQHNWTGVLVQINQQWGWMNFDGQLILLPAYSDVSVIDDKTILVTGTNKKLGAISTTGQQLLPMEYIAIVPKGKVYKVKQTNTSWFYVDKTGTRKACQVY